MEPAKANERRSCGLKNQLLSCAQSLQIVEKTNRKDQNGRHKQSQDRRSENEIKFRRPAYLRTAP
jgi:hypothetical protein